jgi:hypothetical protein
MRQIRRKTVPQSRSSMIKRPILVMFRRELLEGPLNVTRGDERVEQLRLRLRRE